jgi:asparagine synthase (glutamine-hydrolysing)
MCGILGILSAGGTSPAEAVAALNSIRHRGPDDEGMLLGRWRDGTVAAVRGDDSDPALEHAMRHWKERASGEWQVIFGHRRLSILDLSPAGHQPMSRDEGRYWITFNGEVYNYVELRRELEELGDRFFSGTDTEVILAAYARWGVDCVKRFTGMWAFAVWDRRENTVFLSRDPFGIKPLYYSLSQGRLAFCSEIKGLQALPWISRRQDPQAVYDFLAWSKVESVAGRTLLAEVREMPPATRALVRLNDSLELKPERYWSPPCDAPVRDSLEESAERFRELFLASIRLHLRSDVPVGAALSGGLDSTSIVCAMRQVGGPELGIHTFSYLADDDRINEEKWMDMAGAASGAIMHKIKPVSEDIPGEMDELIRCQDMPFGSTSIYAQHRVFRLVKEKGIKVTMDGQGPDEMFAGYFFFSRDRAVSLFNHGRFAAGWAMAGRAGMNPLKVMAQALMPQNLRPFMRKHFGRPPVPAWMDGAWVKKNGVDAGYKEPVFPRRERLRHTLRDSMLFSSIPSLLRFEDRNSMHYSVESRVPFLTTALAEAALSMPEEHLLAPDGTTKHILRRAFRGLVPEAILDRRDKIGFSTPEAGWMTKESPWVLSVLDVKRVEGLGVFRTSALPEMVTAMLGGKVPYQHWLWRALNYVRWAELNNVEPCN